MASISLFTEIFVFKQKRRGNRQIFNPIVNMYRSPIEVKLRGRFFDLLLDIRLAFSPHINQLKTRHVLDRHHHVSSKTGAGRKYRNS